MPIYEYQCANCHHQFDLIQKISAPSSTQCPHCFENTAKRLISAAGIQLKGTGWYVTDFKHKGTKEGAKMVTPPESSEKKPSDSTPKSTKE